METLKETIVDEGKFLSFDKEKVQVLTMEQLRKTHMANDIYGNPLRGIYHHDLLSQVQHMANEQGYGVEIYDLFAAQNKNSQQPGVILLPQIEEQYGKNAVEAHILNRVFANIRLTDFDDNDNTTNLAVSYHQRGIQVGFGNMVKICHNQCMLGADRYAATYSDKGLGRGNGKSIPELLDIVKSWLVDARRIIVDDREKIERMKNIDVTADKMLTIIGLLTTIRVKCDTLKKEIRDNRIYPLNQSQINQLTEDMLVIYHNKGSMSLWDLYDSATNMYKATRMDIPQLLPQNLALTEFINEQFQL